jgi:hypothetical protein
LFYLREHINARNTLQNEIQIDIHKHSGQAVVISNEENVSKKMQKHFPAIRKSLLAYNGDDEKIKAAKEYGLQLSIQDWSV